MSRTLSRMPIRFFNTYEPVTSLYRDLIPALAQEGREVEVYVSGAEYRPGRDLAAALRGIPGLRFRRMPNLGLHARHGTLAKAVISLAYCLSVVLTTLFRGRAYQNVFLTQPPLIPVLGALLSRLYRQPYHIILMDLQPQLAAAVGMVNEHSPMTRLLDRLNRWSLRNATGVIVIGRCMAERVARLGVELERIHVVPNWADVHRFRPVPAEENTLRRAMGWNGRTILMFAGNIGLPQPFDPLLDAAEALQEDERLRVVIIGDGVRRARLAENIERRGLSNVELHPFLHDRFELAEILSAGDIHFVPLHPAVTGLAVPSKTYPILAAGRPLIFQGDAQAEPAQMIQEAGIGTVVPAGDAQGLREVITEYLDNPTQRLEKGQWARNLAVGRYSAEKSVAKYLELLRTDSFTVAPAASAAME